MWSSEVLTTNDYEELTMRSVIPKANTKTLIQRNVM